MKELTLEEFLTEIKLERNLCIKNIIAKSIKVNNQTINDITRKGKWLIFDLNDYVLLSHLRMEGKYFYKEKDTPLLKHEHIIFHLSNNYHLRYHDIRKFGKMHLLKKKDLDNYYIFSKLGLDPWDNNLNINYLKNKFKSNLPIKTLLLNQSIITGIGNIYADEILFYSGINPFKKGKDLTDEDLENIINNTKLILTDAIKNGGTTIKSYVFDENKPGSFQNKLAVHGRKNKNCFKCNEKILKVKIGTRGTYFCPKCQKELI